MADIKERDEEMKKKEAAKMRTKQLEAAENRQKYVSKLVFFLHLGACALRGPETGRHVSLGVS